MDELGPENRALIDEAVAARTPSAADRARVKEKLIAAGAIAGVTGAATGAAQASSALSATKIISALVLVGVTSGAVVWWSSETPSDAAVAEREEQDATAVEATAVEATAVEAPAIEATPAEAPAIEATAIEAAPTEATEPSAVSDEAAAEPDDARSARARRRRAPPPRAESLADDVALLHRAQAERARDPARALELALEHRRRFPRSPLTAERTALHVLLLCDLGRRSAAARLGERFLARTEDSPLRRSVEESCVRR